VTDEPPEENRLQRIAAAALIALAFAVTAVVLLVPGDGHTIHARFINASQIVKGNLVEIAGRPVGTVTRVELTENGQADLTLRLDADAVVREGTRAVVRAASLSGVANRYVELQPGPGTAPPIPDGGVITPDHTTSAVDLDQIFNVFGRRQRRALSQVIRGSGAQYAGHGNDLNRGLAHLDPVLVASRRLTAELNRDPAELHRLVTRSGALFTDVAERRDELAGVVAHLAVATGAVSRRRAGLADAIARLPAFMRRSNTTFVNLRATLGDLEPLVEESKPVARRLGPVLDQLRPLAAEARPTLRDLAGILRGAGEADDLVDLTRSAVPLRRIAIGPVRAHGARRPGAFPASTEALRGSAPELAFARPYAPELTGWFDDFSHSGPYDALGGIARVALHVNLFTLEGGLPTGTIIPPELRQQAFLDTASIGQNNRCPGAVERDSGDGSMPYKPTADFACDPRQVPLGP
jgi:phospholipid/cholesterol/gamma-HCH transport system substrate-binding protein